MNNKILTVTDNEDGKTRRKGALLTSCLLIMLSVLLVASACFAADGFSWRVENASGSSAPITPGQTLKVTNERPLTVLFSFTVKGDVSRVRFTISQSDRDNGITLLKDTVKVKGNVATSRLLLNIHRGVPLGRHDLYIQAFDAERNVIIFTGKIPFILLPAGSECMCQMVPAKKKSENTTQGGIENA